MNGFEQYQYAEMMRQSRNSAIYHMLLARQGVAGGDGKKSDPPVTPEQPAQLSTYMEFSNGTSQWFDFSGEITQQTMADTGLFNLDTHEWIEHPTKVEIGNKVTSIGNNVFEDCSGLTSVTIPDLVTKIGDTAFYNCSELTTVTIGNGVKSIGTNAFMECHSLTTLTIPSSVETIGVAAFYNTSLEELIMENRYTTDVGLMAD